MEAKTLLALIWELEKESLDLSGEDLFSPEEIENEVLSQINKGRRILGNQP